jgi:hypothetical protein
VFHPARFPTKKTALVKAAFDAATSNADLSPLDFLLGVMRDSSLPPDWRMKAAQTALPYVHSKPASSPAADPAVSAKQVEGMSEEEKRARDRKADLSYAKLCGHDLSNTEAEELERSEKAYPFPEDDPLYPVLQAMRQVSPEDFKADQKAEISRDVDGAVGSDVLLD